jgi:hypothetical protein
VRCAQCGQDELVALSCRSCGFCPSCGGRRLADTAAHLVDSVLPEVRVRQWLLSFPTACASCSPSTRPCTARRGGAMPRGSIPAPAPCPKRSSQPQVPRPSRPNTAGSQPSLA